MAVWVGRETGKNERSVDKGCVKRAEYIRFTPDEVTYLV